MWNVYAEVNGKVVLEEQGCATEQVAWDVVEYLDHIKNYAYPLWVEFVGLQ